MDGRDLLDFPPAFDAGSIDLTGVVLTLSNRLTELSGTVEGLAGIAAADFAVLVFPADRVFWQPRSRRIAWTTPDATGGFVFRGLPPGEYVMVLLPASSAEALRKTARSSHAFSKPSRSCSPRVSGRSRTSRDGADEWGLTLTELGTRGARRQIRVTACSSEYRVPSTDPVYRRRQFPKANT